MILVNNSELESMSLSPCYDSLAVAQIRGIVIDIGSPGPVDQHSGHTRLLHETQLPVDDLRVAGGVQIDEWVEMGGYVALPINHLIRVLAGHRPVLSPLSPISCLGLKPWHHMDVHLFAPRMWRLSRVGMAFRLFVETVGTGRLCGDLPAAPLARTTLWSRMDIPTVPTLRHRHSTGVPSY